MFQQADVVAVTAAVASVQVSSGPAVKPAAVSTPPPPPPARPVTSTGQSAPVPSSSAVASAQSATAPPARQASNPPAPKITTPVPAGGVTTAHGGVVYGLDAALAKKAADKYDPELERQAEDWITAITTISRPHGSSFAQWLHDGTVLCALANNIRPGSVGKVNTSTMPFKQMENITAFLRVCRSSLGVLEHDLFETVDLYEEKDINSVVRCLHALGRSVQALNPPYSGPALGPRIANQNPRNFSEEQLARSRVEALDGAHFQTSGSHGVMNRSTIDTTRNVTFGHDATKS
jgi:hypothetical protein